MKSHQKNFRLVVLIFITGLARIKTQAQGTLYVSNLNQTQFSNMAVGSDSWIAQVFGTGTNSAGYTLNSVQLLLNAAAGVPNGFSISIYGNSSGGPQNNLGTLIGANPTNSGFYTYTTSGISLLPSTGYYVVVTAATSVAQGAYYWSSAGRAFGGQGWSIGEIYYGSNDGLDWSISRQYSFQLSITATAVPEPSVGWLAGLGLLCISFWRRWQNRQVLCASI